MKYTIIEPDVSYTSEIAKRLDDYRFFYKQESNFDGSKAFIENRFKRERL